MMLKFQNLIRSEGLFTPVITHFPRPMAVYLQDGTLAVANLVFSIETGLSTADSPPSACLWGGLQ